MMFGLRRVIRSSLVSSVRVRAVRCLSGPSGAVLFNDVTVEVDGKRVANKLSFRLERGDRIALTGANEQGRRAIFELLKREITPSGGQIESLDGKSVLAFVPIISRKDQALTISNYLSKQLPTASTSDIEKALNDAELGNLRLARTVNTISSSDMFRLKIVSFLLKKPDFLLVDNNSLEDVSSSNTQFLSQILKANSTNSTVIMNLYDEDFLQNTVSSVLEIGAIDVPATHTQGQSYAAAKTLSEEKRKQLNAAAIAAIRAEVKQRRAQETSPEALEALNQIGFENASAAVSQEEYIRVMLIAMFLHPPLALAMYSLGLFDAIL